MTNHGDPLDPVDEAATATLPAESLAQSDPAPPPAEPAGTGRWVLGLLLVALAVGAVSAWTLSARDGLRNPDEAAYAQIARSWLATGSFESGFVRHHHVAYDPDIVHPEDFYPPGNGLLIAAAWRVLGESDFANAVPSLLLATLLLPLLAFGLARRLGAAPPFAFGCGMVVLFDPLLRDHAYQGLADLPLTAAVTLAALLALGRGHLASVAAGLALAAAFWLKPAAILFAPGIALLQAIAERQPLRVALTRMALFSGAFVAGVAPWLWRNVALFGDPLHSGNKYLSAAANNPDWVYADDRRVFWSEEGFDLHGLAGSVGAHPGAALKRFLFHLYEIVVKHGQAAFGLPFAVGALLLFRERRVLALLTLIATYALALSAVFAVFLRYLMPLYPIVHAIAWAAAARVASAVAASGPQPLGSRIWARPAAIALLLTAVGILPGAIGFAKDSVYGAFGKFVFVNETEAGHIAAARFAQDHLPEDAKVLAHEALRFRHISGLRTVNTPWDDPAAIEAVVEHYRLGYAFQTFDGDASSMSNAFFGPYLEAYGDRWRRFETGDGGYALWIRAGFPDPH